jgi:hypothetical protein
MPDSHPYLCFSGCRWLAGTDVAAKVGCGLDDGAGSKVEIPDSTVGDSTVGDSRVDVDVEAHAATKIPARMSTMM